jgi:hypothetical protein
VTSFGVFGGQKKLAKKPPKRNKNKNNTTNKDKTKQNK